MTSINRYDRLVVTETLAGLPAMILLASLAGMFGMLLTLWAPTPIYISSGLVVGLTVLVKLVIVIAEQVRIDVAAGRCLKCGGEGDYYWSTGHVSTCSDCKGTGELVRAE